MKGPSDKETTSGSRKPYRKLPATVGLLGGGSATAAGGPEQDGLLPPERMWRQVPPAAGAAGAEGTVADVFLPCATADQPANGGLLNPKNKGSLNLTSHRFTVKTSPAWIRAY